MDSPSPSPRPRLLLVTQYPGAASRQLYLVAPRAGEPAWRARKEIQANGGEVLFADAPDRAPLYRLRNWVGQHRNLAGFYVGVGYMNYQFPDDPHRGLWDVQQSWASAVAKLGNPAEVLVVRV
ncbi:hypothetical protein LJ737_20000 [Hymenobacter sp. 15J16-1T3B]|uniref:hypothetical protein n=1 Tax=Hymenobacter sp. 15J16-1T3B TaxID=2886941 RepID=UPI001D1289DC|nr:hypothetical protein [Hymenobacter sp. 15J16-1T3B]MCC3159536.1 hypothetical protein [Hymenobacter sp. 15J16-1T3B]